MMRAVEHSAEDMPSPHSQSCSLCITAKSDRHSLSCKHAIVLHADGGTSDVDAQRSTTVAS